MNPGDTFLLYSTDIDEHLWIVISDHSKHPNSIVVVNLTSFRKDKEQTVVLEKGEYPFIRHRTVVNFAAAKDFSLQDLEKIKDSLKLQEPVSAQLLGKIRVGAEASRQIPLKINSTKKGSGKRGQDIICYLKGFAIFPSTSFLSQDFYALHRFLSLKLRGLPFQAV